MKAFVWNQAFMTGLDSVDSQHARLVDIINELSEVMLAEDKISEGRMQILFKDLSDYAREHFQDEEALMRRHHLDARHLDAHIKHHHEFVEQLGSMWRSRAAMQHPCQVIYGFLSSWLAYHILAEDQSMARQIERVKAGETPAVAFEKEEQPLDKGTAALLKALQTTFNLLSEQSRDLAEMNQRLLKEIATHRGAHTQPPS
jgi:two-component system, NtrC family, sensor kinase